MPHVTTTRQELATVWRLVRADRKYRCFVAPPNEERLVAIDLNAWFDSIALKLGNGNYAPSAVAFCDVPKGGGLVRPGAYINIEDHLVYSLLVFRNLQEIASSMELNGRRPSYDNKITMSTRPADWFIEPMKGWSLFREDSLKAIGEGYPYVVVADITGYYEAIDVAMLASDLRHIGFDENDLSLLSRCLNKWALVAGRGIPQGYGASDILAKLYLANVDEILRTQGFRHVRYVDDFRFFCQNEYEAKRALLALSKSTRSRALFLQSSKSKVMSAGEARSAFGGAVPTIEAVRQRLSKEASDHIGQIDSITDAQIFAFLEELEEDAPLAVLRDTYEANFMKSTTAPFDKSLFRYIIKRMGAARDDFALGHVLSLLKDHPQETEAILEYIANVDADAKSDRAIAAIAFAESNPYVHQRYWVWQWASSAGASWHRGEILEAARRSMLDMALPKYVRTAAWGLLAEAGQAFDLESLQGHYGNVGDPLEQCELLCALKRMESNRRNAFLARHSSDSQLHEFASRLARA